MEFREDWASRSFLSISSIDHGNMLKDRWAACLQQSLILIPWRFSQWVWSLSLWSFFQLSFIQHSLMSPEVFCFADYPCHTVATDILKAPPEDDNREIATWYEAQCRCVDTVPENHSLLRCSLSHCLLQEKPGPGGEPAETLRGGPVRAGEAAVQLSHQALPRHVGAGTASDLYILAHTAPWAHLHPHAHLSGQPSQLCYYPALCLARTGRCRTPVSLLLFFPARSSTINKRHWSFSRDNLLPSVSS